MLVFVPRNHTVVYMSVKHLYRYKLLITKEQSMSDLSTID